tara:strand:- start:425 stop:550 length:126 start_codon:yes stop_codon:yes gene_type:complete
VALSIGIINLKGPPDARREIRKVSVNLRERTGFFMIGALAV